MSSKLKLTRESTEQLDQLSSNLSLRRNIVCRLAISASLIDDVSPTIEMDDLSGQEFNKSTILGTDEQIFTVLITQHYGTRIPDEVFFSKYVRAEIINGLSKLSKLYRQTNSPVVFMKKLSQSDF